MLLVNKLSVKYRQIAAVQELTLEVREGEIVALIGPNGSGKSTTLLAICGVVSPVAGEILFEGRSLVWQSPENIVRAGISLVPEGRHIFTDMTVEENLVLGATIRKDRAAMQTDILDLMDRFPVLKTYFRSPAGKLSGGEQQQLAIARALLSRPRLLLLDEPSLGLAPLIVDSVFEVIEALRAEGVTILLVEQNAARAVELADRTYVLRAGKLHLQGTRDELLGRTDFVAAYLGV